ncbi:hypothetical protein B1C78_09275 [Thioalkalivibrio denitrificans]|uniref:RiboL-PSP-HEPN domain-containing protein n=1 Tax=Thioalkalivibrio denitrificans TaxID=108003 RepID=A0A1V3NGV2_9GAMM|nr:HEPN domain-containing protein [Thioalkalivibrio denitrificans]OOG24108.1 hypothetical protein B1C78_09275 [Thioalkalivibrio denitrificans]
MLDISRILRERKNRSNRLDLPFQNFFPAAEQCADAARAVLDKKVTENLVPLIERAAIIGMVTAVEVYYKDVLNLVFKLYPIENYESQIRRLHARKYDILDLVRIHQNKIDPIEVILSSFSFQSVDAIDNVFSIFTEGGFISGIVGMRIRDKREPEKEVEWTPDMLEGMRRIFNLRHELVHDQSRHDIITEEIVEDLWNTIAMVIASDFVLPGIIGEKIEANRDS